MDKKQFKEICDYLSKEDHEYWDRWDRWWKSLSPTMQRQIDDAMREHAKLWK